MVAPSIAFSFADGIRTFGKKMRGKFDPRPNHVQASISFIICPTPARRETAVVKSVPSA